MVKMSYNLGKSRLVLHKFVPANRSEQTWFDRTDEVVIAVIFFSLLSLLCLIGLAYLWAH
jgi:hypothetical protein